MLYTVVGGNGHAGVDKEKEKEEKEGGEEEGRVGRWQIRV